MLAQCEKLLGQGLLRLPQKHNYRYGAEAERDLLELLFWSLVGHNEQRLRLLFPDGLPNGGSWKLTEAQGAKEGAEYSESARGKRCGHIFRAGEATYRCVTCAADDTCVLCSRCFDASDHTGHQYQISLSSGNCGCCDCGDDEAWRLPLFCAIHTEQDDQGKAKDKSTTKTRSRLPQDWVDAIRLTISRALDYFCDVISCSPEQLRLPKTEEGIRDDEAASRLRAGWYGEGDQAQISPEFALVLWNDEKHTIRDVANQVSRACRESNSFGLARAQETNDIGRSVVKYSNDLQRLLAVSKIIEQIKVTVTVRSARDTFREQMCGTIVEWLSDIAGCSILDDNEILRHIICEELLSFWRRGSGAYNADIGVKGIDDHQRTENSRAVILTMFSRGQFAVAAAEDDEDGQEDGQPAADDEEEEEEEEEEGPEDEDFAVVHDVDADDEAEEMDIDYVRIGQRILNAVLEDAEMADASDAAPAEATAAEAGEPSSASMPSASTFGGQQQQRTSQEQSAATESENVAESSSSQVPEVSLVHIPRTPSGAVQPSPAETPAYWLVRPAVRFKSEGAVPPYEDLTQRTRLDWLILFDLRLWKKTRTDLRDLYISTVVNVPQFKRIMGLRLSALYTALAQLYLIADREPDHSIVNLSLQLLTTPSITEEIVQRGNFLTKVMAILYTFLTTRQVGEPHEVNPNPTLAFDAGSVTNRRQYHFFLDLRYLLQSEYVQRRLRTEEQYLSQFLDLVKLSQGICPNVRAIGEHVEYEPDAWISASILMREVNRLCRQFCEAFRHIEPGEGANLLRAIKTAAITAINHSVGLERHRFQQAEIKDYVRFKTLPCFNFEVDPSGRIPRHRVVDFVVEKSAISFHHALHYTLSWLLECGRNVSSKLMQEVLFDAARTANSNYIHDNQLGPEDLLLAMFDYPLRVCAWLAQMKAGMWVRNGLSLRHQMSQYRGVSSRDFAYYRDIFLLQTALVTCDSRRVLASIADRFGVVDWMTRNFTPRTGYDEAQMVDVAEEFVHLLVILLTDRTSLTPAEPSTNLTRENITCDIAHILCFKPLSFSDLSTRLSDRLLDSDMFQDVLDEVANFRPPEGLNDTGTFELKPEYIDLVDPYCAHYTKNQREEAENIYKEWMAKKSGKQPSDIVFEPKLRPITAGAYSDLALFTRTRLFAQIVHQCLDFIVSSKDRAPSVPSTRVEPFLQMVLHLILAATLEDDTAETDRSEGNADYDYNPDDNGEQGSGRRKSFVDNALSRARMTQVGNLTVIGLLEKVTVMSEFTSCTPKIRHILKRLWQKRPRTYTVAAAGLSFPFDRVDTSSPAVDLQSEKELKKKQALERQARVMAHFQQQQLNFLSQQGATWTEEDFSDSESEPPEAKIWKFPSGTCILCQEETNDSRLYGTFALIQDSGILRQTDITDPDWVREVLRTPSSLDRSAEHLRPFGVAGENRTTLRKLDSSGGEVISEKIGLGKGFKAANTVRGPVTTGCGHIMHYTCFQAYYSATQKRQTQQIARNHPERLAFEEFICPLCKALGNAFLPIIWKGKEESYPGALKTAEDFGSFMRTEVRRILFQPENYALFVESDKMQPQTYQDLFLEHIFQTLVPPLSSNIGQLIRSPFPSTSHYLSQSSSSSSPPPPPPLPLPASASAAATMAPGPFIIQEDAIVGNARQQSLESNDIMLELNRVYSQLKKTLQYNHIYSNFHYQASSVQNGELLHTDSLIRSFGFSISAAEIAQRGVESGSGVTLLDRIPQLTLTHLRVLAETALSYTAVGCLKNVGIPRNCASREFQEMYHKKICQLFVGHPCMTGTTLLDDMRDIEPLFATDTFVFLAECSLSLLPVFKNQIRHLIQTCYVAEIVKVVVSFMVCPFGLKEELAQRGDAYVNEQAEAAGGARFALTRHFVDTIVSELKANSIGFAEGPPMLRESLLDERLATPRFTLALRQLISSYALTFLRKTVILLHVQHGVDFSNLAAGFGENKNDFVDVSSSELDRLTKILSMPTLDEVFASVSPARNTDNPFDAVLSGWILHWKTAARPGSRYDDERRPLPWPTLSHPAILELIGLPKYYDSLIEEANRRRCPNTKKELSDPSICLFCGDIFCSQAVCCMENNKLGGCNQHLQKCGKNVGLFINIRKCTVLYLHNHNGSWHYAPYLDRHGEVDPGLRRNRQLILNQKRYDRLLRDVWLSHSIPTTISRKLEADINNGGWETI